MWIRITKLAALSVDAVYFLLVRYIKCLYTKEILWYINIETRIVIVLG